LVAACGSSQGTPSFRKEEVDVCSNPTEGGEPEKDPPSPNRAWTNLVSHSGLGVLPFRHASTESSDLTATTTPQLPKDSQQAFSLSNTNPSAWLQPSEGALQSGTEELIPAENLTSTYHIEMQAQAPHSEALQRMTTTESPSVVAKWQAIPSTAPHSLSRIDSPSVGASNLLRTQTSSPTVFREATYAGRHPHSAPLQRDRSLDLVALRKMGLLAAPKQDGILTSARLSPRLQTAPGGARPHELGRYRPVPRQEGGVLESYKSAIELSSMQQIVGELSLPLGLFTEFRASCLQTFFFEPASRDVGGKYSFNFSHHVQK
jgi:hypothetical protein